MAKLSPQRREGRRLARRAYGRQFHPWLAVSVRIIADRHTSPPEMRLLVAQLAGHRCDWDAAMEKTMRKDLAQRNKTMLTKLAWEARRMLPFIHEASVEMH